MKGGLSEAIRKRLHRPHTDCYLATEVLVRKGEDVKARRDEWDAGTKTNVKSFDDGALRLTDTGVSQISVTTSDGFIADLNEARPFDVLTWQIDDAIGPNPLLTKVQLWLSRKRDGGQPTFDGVFKLTLYKVARINARLSAPDRWLPAQVADPILVAANTLASDTQLVDFSLADSELTGVPGVVIDGSFVPVVWSNFGQPPVDPIPGRMLVVVLTAIGGTNTNYGLGTDSGVSATHTVANKGTLRHRQVTTNTDVDGPAWWTISTPSGQVRCAFHLGTYPATGSIAFTGGAKPSLGVAVLGTVEFICRAETPAGTTATFQARVNGGDAWMTVQDGQAPADVGLAVPNPVAYEMQCLLTANATQDATPTVRAIGILDRLVTDVTEIASLSGFTESVDPMSAEVKMADGECRLRHTGARDYRDIATRLVTENDFVDLEVRVFVAHRDVPRGQWFFLDLFRVDDYDDDDTGVTLVLVSVLERLRGRFPGPQGQLFGWMLKKLTSDVTAGTHLDDFNRALSEVAETADTITVNVAASATEHSRGVTPAGVPNVGHWTPGTWVVQMYVTAANTNIQLAVAIARINAAGVQQEITAFTPEQQATSGAKTFALNGVGPWAPGSATDRLKVVYKFRNTVASAQSVTIETGTLNTQVQAPWFPGPFTEPKVYNLETVQAVFQDWRDVQIGLPERYRGAIPANTVDRLRKNVLDAEGKRELERIAFDSGRVIAAVREGR